MRKFRCCLPEKEIQVSRGGAEIMGVLSNSLRERWRGGGGGLSVHTVT